MTKFILMRIKFGPFACLLAPLNASFAAIPVEGTQLRCEYRANSLGIDVAKPRLSWVTEGGGQRTAARDLRQTAYQILVASSIELLKNDKGDLWDSGKVESDQANVLYSGATLKSSQKVFWKLRVWTLTSDLRPQTSVPSEWSKMAEWTMGLLKAEDWHMISR